MTSSGDVLNEPVQWNVPAVYTIDQSERVLGSLAKAFSDWPTVQRPWVPCLEFWARPPDDTVTSAIVDPSKEPSVNLFVSSRDSSTPSAQLTAWTWVTCTSWFVWE